MYMLRMTKENTCKSMDNVGKEIGDWMSRVSLSREGAEKKERSLLGSSRKMEGNPRRKLEVMELGSQGLAPGPDEINRVIACVVSLVELLRCVP